MILHRVIFSIRKKRRRKTYMVYIFISFRILKMRVTFGEKSKKYIFFANLIFVFLMIYIC